MLIELSKLSWVLNLFLGSPTLFGPFNFSHLVKGHGRRVFIPKRNNMIQVRNMLKEFIDEDKTKEMLDESFHGITDDNREELYNDLVNNALQCEHPIVPLKVEEDIDGDYNFSLLVMSTTNHRNGWKNEYDRLGVDVKKLVELNEHFKGDGKTDGRLIKVSLNKDEIKNEGIKNVNELYEVTDVEKIFKKETYDAVSGDDEFSEVVDSKGKFNLDGELGTGNMTINDSIRFKDAITYSKGK